MTKAKNGDKVHVHYTGKLDNGSIFDSSGGSGYVILSPLEFVIGQSDELLPKFQEAVIGLEPGESVKIKIASQDAFGPHLEELVHEVPREEIQERDERLDTWVYPNGKSLLPFNPRKGDWLEFFDPDGSSVPAKLIGITDDTYTLDANHPLAGKDLNFEITLVDVL
jgi:peptidylprolyl isomerase